MSGRDNGDGNGSGNGYMRIAMVVVVLTPPSSVLAPSSDARSNSLLLVPSSKARSP